MHPGRSARIESAANWSPAIQGGHVTLIEIQSHHLVEKGSRLGRGELQIGRAQLGQLAAPAQERQG
jgi:hypothetical protein